MSSAHVVESCRRDHNVDEVDKRFKTRDTTILKCFV